MSKLNTYRTFILVTIKKTDRRIHICQEPICAYALLLSPALISGSKFIKKQTLLKLLTGSCTRGMG